MILKPIVDEFISHTGLSDEKYLLLFDLISQRLSDIEKVSFLQLKISFVGDNKVLQYNFEEIDFVPSYIVEVILNIFDQGYYVIPQNLNIDFSIKFDNKVYDIIVRNSEVSIPFELQFLQKERLYKLLLVPSLVYDIFYEYDFFFKPILLSDKFRRLSTPMEQKFAEYVSKVSLDENDTTTISVDNKKLIIESLRLKIQEILKKLDSLTKERDELLKNEQIIRNSISLRDSLQVEHDILNNQLLSLKESREYFNDKLSKIKSVLGSIEVELASAIDSNDSTYADFLREKKIVLQSEMESLENSYNGVLKLYESSQEKLSQIKSTLSTAMQYTMSDLDVISKRISTIDKEYDDLYSLLVSFELQLKDYQSQVTRAELSKHVVEMRDVQETKDRDLIINYLEHGEYPQQNIVVYNSLKYFYTYHVTNMATTELKNIYPTYAAEVLQSIASRVFFVRNFGMVLNTVISPYKFMYKNIGRIIHAVRS